ncbi:hypothetical protein [Vibrio breoganii]|uniref:hypothetical protein n=1 Tax=Vibrio breoganii TaxID=553239 RepID=UPI000C82C5C8|nr:hypothetical protein [Vibrio breoganii]PMG98929.1 hypothetical protein BCU80_03235 [Vibrio breoganii]PMK34089.1 hypothetical protein BCU06_00400 [Vibrio breoganii]PML54566.1 hypothetical protein BCT73_15455 [Vibrio breoganii]PMO81348.1 hypothetical protein BCT00_11665 [Vibrio breoganii]
MSRAKIQAIKKRIHSETVVIDSGCLNIWGGDCDCEQCQSVKALHEHYLKYEDKIRSGEITWKEYFYIQKEAGFHAEYDTHEDYMNWARKW